MANDEATCVVYGLSDPRDEQVFYVGQTKQVPPRERWLSHLRQLLDKVNHETYLTKRERVILQIIDSGFEPGFEVIDPVARWDVSEREWIRRYRKRNPNLTNQ